MDGREPALVGCNTMQHTHMHTHIQTDTGTDTHTRTHAGNDAVDGRSYGVATISRLLKIIGLFCRI